MTDYDGFVFVDIESTGLDLNRDQARILQFAMIATDTNGDQIGRFETVTFAPNWREITEPGAVVLHESSGLAGILDWQAKWGPTRDELDGLIVSELDSFGFTSDSKLILGGSNIAGYDRLWFDKFCPVFNSRFGYRTLDVSPIRETLRVSGRKDLTWDEHKKSLGIERVKHHAMSDAEDSLDEWRFYSAMFQVISAAPHV